MATSRLCPVCRVSLSESKLQTQIVDRCPQCNGIYFDKGELDALNQLVCMYTQMNLSEDEIDTIPEAEKNRQLLCPADGTLMSKVDIASHIIDECPQCKGIWLDDHEVVALKISERHINQNLSLYFKLGDMI